ncbi:PIN domain-containing protein [Xanthobacter sp. KR7-225]|uniref:PIN domain-containing protein n=1 Tax=Xanthobacter sp. KR7-225 TaxID=3156613 RepID=UPI0032B49935
MIGLDTNVLLRIFIEDDPPSMHHRAVGLLEGLAPEAAMVNPIVLAEATRTLVRRMKRSRQEVATFVASLLNADVIELSCADAVRRALGAYAGGKADFADYLIAELNAEAGCRTTYTFDIDAGQHTGYSSVP